MTTPRPSGKATETVTGAPSEANSKDRRVIVDFGTKKRKEVKALRKGTGKLMCDLDTCLDELRTSGALSGDAQTVIVIVKERSTRSSGLRLL